MKRTEAERFLLGELTEAESARFEERLLADGILFEEALAAECDLLDQYARSGLSAHARRGLEAGVLATAGGQTRLRFAEQLRQAIASRRPARSLWPWTLPARPWSAIAAAACLLAALATGYWTRARISSLRAEVAELRLERDRLLAQRQARDRTPAQEQARAPERAPGPAEQAPVPPPLRVARFVLGVGALRGAGHPRLRLPRTAHEVRLSVDLEGAATYRRLRALIRTEDAVQVFAHELPTPKDEGLATLEVAVPATLLGEGGYVLTVEGWVDGSAELAGAFPFRVDPR